MNISYSSMRILEKELQESVDRRKEAEQRAEKAEINAEEAAMYASHRAEDVRRLEAVIESAKTQYEFTSEMHGSWEDCAGSMYDKLNRSGREAINQLRAKHWREAADYIEHHMLEGHSRLRKAADKIEQSE